MTEEEHEAAAADLAEAVDRAVEAGLRLRSPGGNGAWLDVTCPVCGAGLTLPGQPWNPALTARRLDVFAVIHRDHTGRGRTLEEEW